MADSLYERLGGSEGITQIASDALDNHLINPRIKSRYEHLDHLESVRSGAANFFISATGGPDVYEGGNMLETHKGMNIDEAEYMAVVDDILDALDKNSIAQREQEEVLFALYSMRREILHV
ncbi:MAG: group 1 truncated hemoglobin [Pontiella sp.]|nr:group 1 truncated hemoglobin [Pontiella sp.]MBT8046615.1 group 1 truncated hemoglobin [Pontiella sp.]NNJ70782.1 group 1 truncated hemoglobin [Kiritimatiellales bacterium]